MSEQWRPLASCEILRRRAQLLHDLREFLDRRSYLEVETPILSQFANPDPHIDSFRLSSGGTDYFLHTSPEFPMKRLLAAGIGSLYQIGKVFRQGEYGRLHNPEFTMLEWYRVGFDYHQFMAELDEMLQQKCHLPASKKLTYAAIFEEVTGLNMHQVGVSELRQYVLDNGVKLQGELGDHLDTWRDLVMTHFIEPRLGQDAPVFIYDYPASQAALAQVRPGENPVALRFELYFKGIELVNGYQELTDPEEQERRFCRQNEQRHAMGLPEVPIDRHLIRALNEYLPLVSGAALGVDRLLMLMTNSSSIKEVLSFDFKTS